MKKQLLLVVLIILLILVPSCDPNSLFDNEEGESNTIKKSFVIKFKYMNEDGNSPKIELMDDTSPEISFTNYSVGREGVGVRISFENLSINNETTYFKIQRKEDISCQILEGEKWVTDTEFTTDLEAQSKIAIVLVLDKSRSISPDNFEKIKSYARNFIDIIYRTNNHAEIGLVSFASYNEIDFLDVHPESTRYRIGYGSTKSHVDHLKDHINAMSQGEFTALFDAINKAHSLINFDNYEGCAIVSFTDGQNNNSMVIQQNDLIAKLSNANNLKSFTIGFGDVKDSELQALAVNGQYKRVNSIKDLETVFDTFSKTVSSFHKVTLRRPLGIVPDWITMRLKLGVR